MTRMHEQLDHRLDRHGVSAIPCVDGQISRETRISDCGMRPARRSRFYWITVSVVFSVIQFLPVQSTAQESFFAGQTLRIVVGYAPGGGFDVFSRAIARHMSQYIPGNPVIIVDNMPGAGSLITADYIYSKAPPDGLTIGNFSGGSLVLQQIMGRSNIQFDARKFQWIGVPARDNIVCALTKAANIATAEQWMASKTAVKLGGLSPGNATDDVPKILTALGFPIQLVSGYRGIPEIQLAAERQEVFGGCFPWETMRRTWGPSLARGEVRVVLQVTPHPNPQLPNVPLASKYAKTSAEQELLKFGVYDPVALNRPYAVPPGTPLDRVETLRSAFLRTLRDPEFQAEAKKLQLGDIEPITGDQVKKTIEGFFDMSPERLVALKNILLQR